MRHVRRGKCTACVGVTCTRDVGHVVQGRGAKQRGATEGGTGCMRRGERNRHHPRAIRGIAGHARSTPFGQPKTPFNIHHRPVGVQLFGPQVKVDLRLPPRPAIRIQRHAHHLSGHGIGEMCGATVGGERDCVWNADARIQTAQFAPVNSPAYWNAVHAALGGYDRMIIEVQDHVRSKLGPVERTLAGRWLAWQSLTPPMGGYRAWRRPRGAAVN